MARAGFGSSNYGNALADFEDGWMRLLDNKTTVIILGDGRGNRTDPRIDIMQRMADRAKQIIWLNPEFRTALGHRRFRHVALCAALPRDGGVQHAAAPGAGDRGAAAGRRVEARLGREKYSLPKPHPSFLWAWHLAARRVPTQRNR